MPLKNNYYLGLGYALTDRVHIHLKEFKQRATPHAKFIGMFGVTTEWQRTYNGELRDDGINHVRGGPQVLRPVQGRPRHRARGA